MDGRRWMGAGISVLATLLLLGALLQFSHPAAEPYPAGKTATSADPAFVVGEWNGKLAVFVGGHRNPDTVYEDVAVATLPPAEQERLKAGIPLPDRAALHRLLEDYTG